LNKYQEQSSIVLSQHLTDTVDDGYLTVKEIESMNIPADLVVLSGCSKQANGNDDGYGVHNFSSSFILAGVNAMVLSLWVTTDEAREKFMGGLYEQLRGGVVTTAVAVKQVKERFIRGDFGDEYRNPHYWAPFIYIGR
jgi:CHAT domain-containing protein